MQDGNPIGGKPGQGMGSGAARRGPQHTCSRFTLRM
jgi:hypothetical protein